MCTVFVAPPMSVTVLLCFLVVALKPCSSRRISREVAYECGPHGKFEYCIDEIPGCVVGCHCHPGYYFDTDTKICEPNVKLTQHFRHHLAEPTPTATVYPTNTPIPTPSATAHYDDNGHEAAKDTDELGDWLYNQFFKTIESQVINNSNNTKSTINDKPPTRRSGGGRTNNKTKRKIRKTVRSRKKRKHAKGRGLRRKLLRITEDDSLFDSDSDSDSDDSSSSESDSSSDSSADIDSSDGKKSVGPDTDAEDDKDHGHKKVIIFNRRPKPPLPSFIFLPSMDTPYYPPIGLPPPPLVPMYPMVPVPPMAPPFPSFPGPPKCDEESSKATTTTIVEPTTTSTTTATESTTHSPESPQDPPLDPDDTPIDPGDTPTDPDDAPINPPNTPVDPPEPPTDPEDPPINPPNTPADPPEPPTDPAGPPSIRRNRPEKHRKRPILKKLIMRANEPGKQKKLKHGQQNKLMQKLRDKLKGKRRNSKKPTHSEPVEEIQDEELQNTVYVPNISEEYTPHKQIHEEDQEENNIPKLEDVDFKYLSELIHRVNQSKSRNRLPLPFDLNEDLKELRKLQLSQPTRRNFDSYKPMQQVHRQGTDEIYYSNLGRQIATMIRNADSKVDHQFIKDSEHAERQVPIHSFLNEHSYGPRSFWERSVRSPVPQKGSVFEYLDESRTLKHSNEKSLINLENEVQIFASTQPPLRLQDLENILSTIQKAHAQIQFRQPITSTKQSNVSLNVNLLPKHVRSTYGRLFDAPEKVEYITEHYGIPSTQITPLYVEMHRQAVAANTSVFHEPERKYNLPFSDYWMFNPEPIQPKTKPKQLFVQTSKPIIGDTQIYYTNPARQLLADFVQPKHNETKKLRGERLQFLKSRPITKQTTPKTFKPKVVKYKSLNYFSGNKHLMFEAASYPLLVPFKTQVSKRMTNRKPSYFHHQSHRFEYFD